MKYVMRFMWGFYALMMTWLVASDLSRHEYWWLLLDVPLMLFGMLMLIASCREAEDA